MRRREFHRLVRQAFQELPSGVRNALENVDVLVEDWPSDDDLNVAGLATSTAEGPSLSRSPERGEGEAEGKEGRHHLFGLYTGVPLPDRAGGPPPLPDTITLFQRPIESACASREEVVREIRVTLLHEVGHYLGMSEEDLEHLGYG